MTDIALPSPEELRRRLEELRRSRGFLLPHHGAMAAAMPDLHDAYFVMYRALTLSQRHLDAFEKEFVWLAILIATDEALATHHIAKFKAAGGGEAELEIALRLAAFAHGARDFRFVDAHWKRHVPGFDRWRWYRAALEALVAGRVAPRLVELALAATHTCLAQWDELALHIRGAYDAGVPEAELAEALSLAMFPGSVPHFVEAARVWRDLVRAGDVPASETFRRWAAIDQGGFDGTV